VVIFSAIGHEYHTVRYI